MKLRTKFLEMEADNIEDMEKLYQFASEKGLINSGNGDDDDEETRLNYIYKQTTGNQFRFAKTLQSKYASRLEALQAWAAENGVDSETDGEEKPVIAKKF